MSQEVPPPDSLAPGDPAPADQLLTLVYDELRRLAAGWLAREAPGQTLQPTALVHEAYLRLAGTDSHRQFNDRQHFFRAAATAMRRILIDRARGKRAQKRGGGQLRQSLDGLAAAQPDEDLLALDEALDRFAACEPLKAQLVELRYFVGLTGEEAAAALDISPATADRWWSYARAWLQAEIQGR
jgi:RNA polymerase sigma factor (TIGR02999 family)